MKSKFQNLLLTQPFFQSRYLLPTILLFFNAIILSESQDFLSYARNYRQYLRPQMEVQDYSDYGPGPYRQEDELFEPPIRKPGYNGRRPQTRIRGGREGRKGEKPFQIWLGLDGKFRCGAALIDALNIQAVLTAAHCVWIGPGRGDVLPASRLQVTAGDWMLEKDEGTEITRQVTKVVMNPYYEHESHGEDIAILFFEGNEFPHTEFIDTILLPRFGVNDPPPRVEISGWGAYDMGEPLENILRVVSLPTAPTQDCLKWDLTDKQYCVESEGQNGQCSGDSGGPAVATDPETGNLVLYGLVSFHIGDLCGHPTYPSVNTKVSKYVDWIRIKTSEYLSS